MKKAFTVQRIRFSDSRNGTQLHLNKTSKMKTCSTGLAIFMWLLWAKPASFEHKGNRFIFSFTENNSTLPPEIYIISLSGKDVALTIRAPLDPTFGEITSTIPHDRVKHITLPVSMRMLNGQIGNKGIEITSSDDIIVYGKNPTNGTSDVYLILPIDDIGDDYIVASHKTTGESRSNIGIVATQPNTEIVITVPNLGRNISLEFGENMCEGGQMFSFGLTMYETAQLESIWDVTGVKITSNHPIAVLTGETSKIIDADGARLVDHFECQLSPTRNWGKTFVAVPRSFSDFDDIFHIIAKENDTAVHVKKRSQLLAYQLAESHHAKINVTKEDYISIEADKPVLVLQYVITQIIQRNCKSECGSFILMVPPMQQKECQYLFSTVNAAGKQSVNLIVATPLRDGLLINGTDLLSYISNFNSNQTPTWNIINRDSKNNYSAIQFLVNGGMHKISHNSSNALFAATSVQHSKDLTNSSKSHSVETMATDVDKYEMLSENNAIPTGKFEKANSKDEINNAYLAKPESIVGKEISTSVIAVIASLCSAVLFVIICIVGFVFAEFAFHNGERSLFRSSRVAPYEQIED